MGDSPKKTYFPWGRPLLSSATEWLLADSDERLVDLSDGLLLLPTQQAGRRLREALATAMAVAMDGVVAANGPQWQLGKVMYWDLGT